MLGYLGNSELEGMRKLVLPQIYDEAKIYITIYVIKCVTRL